MGKSCRCESCSGYVERRFYTPPMYINKGQCGRRKTYVLGTMPSSIFLDGESTRRNHGGLAWHEQDSRTHTCPPADQRSRLELVVPLCVLHLSQIFFLPSKLQLHIPSLRVPCQETPPTLLPASSSNDIIIIIRCLTSSLSWPYATPET
jgi:hypothetical protein